MRPLVSVVVVCGIVCLAARARGGERACDEIALEAQELRDEGHVIAAERLFQDCAADRCPEIVRRDCRGWLVDVDGKIARIRVELTGPEPHNGEPRIWLDGDDLGLGVPRVLRVDPGAHVLRIEVDGTAATDHFTVRAGENRTVTLLTPNRDHTTPAPTFDPKVRSRRTTEPLVWALAGAGVVAIAVGAVFGVTGLKEAGNYSACGSNCDAEAVSGTRSKLIAADVAIGVGALSILAAGFLYFRSGPVVTK